MPLPYHEPRLATTYVVTINSEASIEYSTLGDSAKVVADNIYAGKSAEVVFSNAADLQSVRQKFNLRVDDCLRLLGHNSGFGYEPNAVGAKYRPK
jgi:hypothetical protein